MDVRLLFLAVKELVDQVGKSIVAHQSICEPSLELLDLVCRKQMLQGSCTLRTSLVAEAKRKAAQLTAKEKSTGLSLSANQKECPGAMVQGREYGDVGQCTVMGKQQALQPGALPTGHPCQRVDLGIPILLVPINGCDCGAISLFHPH